MENDGSEMERETKNDNDWEDREGLCVLKWGKRLKSGKDYREEMKRNIVF